MSVQEVGFARRVMPFFCADRNFLLSEDKLAESGCQKKLSLRGKFYLVDNDLCTNSGSSRRAAIWSITNCSQCLLAYIVLRINTEFFNEMSYSTTAE